MNRIVLTPEQASQIHPLQPVEICGPDGNHIACIPPQLTPEEIARIPRSKDSKGPLVPAAQVHEMLRVLEETWEREGPFGQERLDEILEEVRARRRGS